MKKLLIVLPQLRTGGGQKVAVEEAIGLARRGADVTLLSLYPREDTVFTRLAEEKGIKLLFLNKSEGKSLRMFSDVRRIVKKISPDVIHTHLMALPYTLYAVMGCHAKRYHTVHNVAEKEAEGLMRVFSKLAYRFFGFTPIAISPYCRKTIADLYHISEDRIPTIANGVDTSRFACKIPYKDRMTTPFTILSTGRMEAQKRHDLMITTFAEFHQRHPNSRLILLGDGPNRPQLEEHIRALSLSDAVLLPGIVSDVENYLNHAHLYLQTSQWEGLPLSVLEAMSCGLPVVATKAGGTVDILPASAGYLVEVGDQNGIVHALETLSDDPALRARLSESAIQVAQEYDSSRCIDGYAKLFAINDSN